MIRGRATDRAAT